MLLLPPEQQRPTALWPEAPYRLKDIRMRRETIKQFPGAVVLSYADSVFGHHVVIIRFTCKEDIGPVHESEKTGISIKPSHFTLPFFPQNKFPIDLPYLFRFPLTAGTHRRADKPDDYRHKIHQNHYQKCAFHDPYLRLKFSSFQVPFSPVTSDGQNISY